MKKYLAWTLAIIMLLSLSVACAGDQPSPIATPEPEEDPEVVVDPSEWETTDTPALTEETTTLFYKAFGNLLGVNYVPLVYLGKQVITGTVHTYLARATVIYPGAKETYALVFLYEEPNGNVRIMDISFRRSDRDGRSEQRI